MSTPTRRSDALSASAGATEASPSVVGANDDYWPKEFPAWITTMTNTSAT
jgi:hypothetical protein